MGARALGGAPLLGSELARFVYLDEAGISGRKQEPWLVVGGLLVHGDHQLDKLYADVEKVLEEHIPEKYRDGLMLHACDVYGGYGKTFDKRKHPYWTAEKRMPILAALADIVRRGKFGLTWMGIERAKFPTDLELPKDSPIKASAGVVAHASAYLACLIEVDMWLRKNAKRENCMAIVENNNEARALIRFVHRHNQRKATLVPDDLKPKLPLRRVREDPAFQEKLSVHPLVLADFVAFTIKRLLMGDEKILPFVGPWRSRLFEMSSRKAHLLLPQNP